MNKRKEIEDEIKPFLYKDKGYTMIDFEGTRSDYKVPMIFLKITPKGNLRLREILGTKTGGIPDQFKNRIAQLRERDGEHYWWIENGTGSMIFKRR